AESMPAHVPPAVAGLIGRCLQPDPAKRQRDAADARLEIEEALAELSGGPSPTPAPPGKRGWPWGPVGAGAAALAAFALGRYWPVMTEGPPIADKPVAEPGWSGQLLLGGAARAYQPVVSPDGKWLAFIVHHEGQAQVGVMKLASGEWWVLTRNR